MRVTLVIDLWGVQPQIALEQMLRVSCNTHASMISGAASIMPAQYLLNISCAVIETYGSLCDYSKSAEM